MYTTKQQKPQQSRVIVSAHSPLQQRPFVTQRVKFKYDSYETGNLHNESGIVFFTEYKGEELYSSDFSGCIMAAFKFLKDDNISDIEFDSDFTIDKNKEYIAHVFSDTEEYLDTKYEFAKLEKNGIIRIDAMYKPYNKVKDQADMDNYASTAEPGSSAYINRHNLTGSMFKSNYNGGWIGNTYYQDKDGQVKQIKNYFDNNMILNETYYLKGLLGIPLPEKVFLALEENMKESYINGLRVYFNNLEH